MSTDNEIIKALECCLSDNPPCYRCKYDADTITVDECMSKLMKDALDLINRQKAEIERLEDLNKCYYTSCQQIAKSNHEIKAEAVKEFAERLKEYVESYDVTTGYKIIIVNAVEEETIDNLVKEMVGE